MNRLAILICALVFAACASGGIRVKEAVRVQDCDNVYSHILDIEVQHIFSKSELTDNYSREAAYDYTDTTLQNLGITQKFYTFCTTKMTPAQIDCALASKTFDNINICIK